MEIFFSTKNFFQYMEDMYFFTKFLPVVGDWKFLPIFPVYGKLL